MQDPEFDKRKIAWIALSEFYLDTELDDADYKRLGAELKKTGYSLQKLKEIDLHEVFPVLRGNLLSMAGEWAGFDEEWLIERCNSKFERKNVVWKRCLNYVLNLFEYWMRKRHFTGIAPHL